MGLSFLNWLLLGGAALVAVPILLHLLMRRKPVPHAFPAMRFLQSKAQETRRRIKLQHLLLLLVRAALIFLMALAVARPVLRGGGWLATGEGPVAVACVIDTAPRMLLREGNRTRLDVVSELAADLFAELPRESQIAVLDTNGSGAAFSPSRAAASSRIDRLTTASAVGGLPTAMADAARLLESALLPQRELYVFTDLSRGGWEQPIPPDWEGLHPSISLFFVDVSAKNPQNFALENLELSAEQIAVGSPVTVTVTARRVGPEATRSVAIELLLASGEFLRRGEKPVVWREGEASLVQFELSGLEPGLHQGRVVIEGGDPLGADDAIDFTIEVGPSPRVLVAAPEPIETTALFFTEAVAPLSLVRAGRSDFTVTRVPFTDLETEAWDEFRGMVLLDPPAFRPGTWGLLRQWVSQGRGLVVWLGPQAGPPEEFNSPASEAVLGGQLKRVWRNADRSNYFAPTVFDHPVFAAFRRVADGVPWQDFPVFRHWEFQATAPDDQISAEVGLPASPLVSYRNGLPAVLEKPLGQGRVIVVTTPVSQPANDANVWNLLATGFEPWPFVMLANEMLRHAVASQDDLNITSGEVASLRTGRRDLPTVTVRTPLGDTFPAAVDQQRGAIAITATRQPGSYGVQSGGDVGGVVRGFSVSLPPAATDFRRLREAELTAALGPNHRLVTDVDSLVRDVARERVGVELSGWLLLLAACLLAIDWVLANRFYAPRSGADPEAGAAERFVESVAATNGDEAAQAAVLPPPVPPPPSPALPPPLPADFGLPKEPQS
jgi:hypothetical protein